MNIEKDSTLSNEEFIKFALIDTKTYLEFRKLMLWHFKATHLEIVKDLCTKTILSVPFLIEVLNDFKLIKTKLVLDDLDTIAAFGHIGLNSMQLVSKIVTDRMSKLLIDKAEGEV